MMIEDMESFKKEQSLFPLLGLVPASRKDDIERGIDAVSATGETYQVKHRRHPYKDLSFEMGGRSTTPWWKSEADIHAWVFLDEHDHVESVVSFSTKTLLSCKEYINGKRSITCNGGQQVIFVDRSDLRKEASKHV